MTRTLLVPLSVLAFVAGLNFQSSAVTPPVVRSVQYNGAYTNIFYYTAQPWMNSNTVYLTAEAWLFCNDLNGYQTIVARHYSTNLWFGLNTNRLRFYRSGGFFTDSDGTLQAGKWTHVAVTYDGSFARFYINGVSAGTKSLASAGNNCTNSLSFGGEHDLLSLGDIFAGGYAFNGNLDEVRLWNVARSQSAIAANMYNQVRSGAGLLATFGSGGDSDDLHLRTATTDGIAASSRWSGFGILPAELCIPRTGNALSVDANIDILNEYRGAETLVLRSANSFTVDRPAYLMVSTNGTDHYLYVGIPDLQQWGNPLIPGVEVRCDRNVADTWPGLGDWRCEVDQDTLQGGNIYSKITFPAPGTAWIGWGQSVSNWQGTTAASFEFDQNYEFRIHESHLNYFTNSVGLMIRYYDVNGSGNLAVAPFGAVTNVPASYAQANWCGQADTDLSTVSLSGSVTNISTHSGKSGLSVSLYSGDSELGGLLLATTTTDAQGKFAFNSVLAPNERRLAVAYASVANSVYLEPAIDTTFSSRVPVTTNSPFSVTYLPCPSICTYAKVNFRYRSIGPVAITGVTPTNVPASVIVRTSPLKTTAGSTFTVSGTNFYPGLQVYFKGSGCSLIPPSLCTSDFNEANIVSQTDDGLSLVAEVPTTLTGVGTSARSFQIVIEAGAGSFIYGPNILVSPPVWPQLNGFEFVNRDDGPCEQEFEASYGDSIFNFLRIRDPYYGIWALVYMAWMDGCHGSCYGMAGTSRLMANGNLPPSTFDTPGGDGVHGVLFADGYLGRTPCEVGGALCPPKPYRWTGFDLFQPYRPLNLWGRITSIAGAQTSAEALAAWLGQLGHPILNGPRRGIAVANPVDVLNRVRSSPSGYTACIYKRDLGGGHCITPYGVIDGMGLDTNAIIPVVAANFSLIKIYDNNWPEEERYIEVNRTDNTFRYNAGLATDPIYDGAGLFYVPLSVYRDARHAPDPFFLAQYGVDFLRFLLVGSESAFMEDTNGGRAGWDNNGITNNYEGALPYVPPATLLDGSNSWDTTMFFLPATNAPATGGFHSAGGHNLLYAGMGWGDIAFGFNAPDSAANNSVDGILIGLSQGLQGMGLHLGAPVTDFGAVVSGRDAAGQSRVFVINGDAGPTTPDIHVQRDGFNSLTIHNRSSAPFDFRLNLSGMDNSLGTFDHSYAPYSLPGNATLKLLLPAVITNPTLTYQLDLNSDGSVDSEDSLPANGQLRVSKAGAMLELRWFSTGAGEILESTTSLTSNEWTTVQGNITNDGQDRVIQIQPGKTAEFFRLRAPVTHCLGLSALPSQKLPNPWETNGFKFEALNSQGGLQPENTIVSRDNYTGLDVLNTMRVYAMDDCDAVSMEVYQQSGAVTIEAVGSLGVVVDRATLTDVGAGPETVTLHSFRGGMQYIRVVSANAQCMILNVCCERAQQPTQQLVSNCTSFSQVKAGQYSSPYPFNGLTVSANPAPVIIGPESGLTGNWLKLKGTVEIQFAQSAETCLQVRMLLKDEEGVVTATAYDVNGAVVGTAGPLPASTTPQQLVVNGTGAVRVVITSNSDKAALQEVCCIIAGKL